MCPKISTGGAFNFEVLKQFVIFKRLSELTIVAGKQLKKERAYFAHENSGYLVEAKKKNTKKKNNNV